MDIAYGLLLADVMWGSEGRYDYRALALRRIHAIKANTVHPGSNLMLLGDWSGPEDANLYRTSRTSDWMPQHFTAFEEATGDPHWSAIRAAHRRAVTHLQSRYSPKTGLLPDFVESKGTEIEPVRGEVLETRHDGDYAFNACRTPWRIGVDAITSGDASSTAAVRRVNAWFRATTDDDPERVGSGYTLGGARYDRDRDNAFWAPLAVAAMTDRTGQRWLDALWGRMAGSGVEARNYYGTTIQVQVMLVVTGHWAAF
jgi:endo-1,4-beta-D-glucanase Y